MVRWVVGCGTSKMSKRSKMATYNPGQRDFEALKPTRWSKSGQRWSKRSQCDPSGSKRIEDVNLTVVRSFATDGHC